LGGVVGGGVSVVEVVVLVVVPVVVVVVPVVVVVVPVVVVVVPVVVVVVPVVVVEIVVVGGLVVDVEVFGLEHPITDAIKTRLIIIERKIAYLLFTE